MEHMQCPSGEHCPKKERGDICLMWHPPSTPNPDTIKQSDAKTEEERLVQIALKRSLEQQCQFCQVFLGSKIDLQIHQLECKIVHPDAHPVGEASDQSGHNEEEKTVRRKSNRKKRKTEKYEAYSQGLTESEGDRYEEQGNEHEEEAKEVSGMLKRLTLEEAHQHSPELEGISGEASSNNMDIAVAEAEKVAESDAEKNEVGRTYNDLGDPIVVSVSTPVKTDENSVSLEITKTSCENLEISEEMSIFNHNKEDIIAFSEDIDVVEVVEDVQHLLDDLDRLLEEHPNDIDDLSLAKKCLECEQAKEETYNYIAKIKDLQEEIAITNGKMKETEIWEKEEESKLQRIAELEGEVARMNEQLQEKSKDQVEKEADDNLELKVEQKDVEIMQLTVELLKKEEKTACLEDNQKRLCVRVRQLLESEKKRNEETKQVIEEKAQLSEQREKERASIVKLKEHNKELAKDVAEKNRKMEELFTEASRRMKDDELNEQLKKETTRKTKQIEELSLRLNDSIETSSTLKIKLQVSCENVNDLTEDIRKKKKELKDQEGRMRVLISQTEEQNEEMKKLKQCIEQARDENTRIKNQAKVDKQHSKQNLSQNPEIAKLYEKFEELKSDITNKLLSFTAQPSNSNPSQANMKKNKRKKKKKKKPEEDVEDMVEINSGNETESDVSTTEPDNMQPRMILRPGHLTYSEAVSNEKKSQKTVVLSTSITRDISEQRFNECFSDGTAEFVRIRGGKAKKIKDDAKKNIHHGYFDSAIVHIGGNDLQDLYYPESFQKLAKEVIETGLICREKGAGTVFIAGITVRKWDYTWERCRLLNRLLRDLCQQNQFVFIDNSNINYVDHLSDGVHLNDVGTKILANNYLGCMYKAFASQR